MSRKDHTPVRVKLVLDEVLMGHVEPTQRAVRAHVDDIYSGVADAGRAAVVSAVMKEINSWPKQEKRKPMSKPKKVLRGKKIIPVAAPYFRANPDLTAQECYQAMLRDGHRIEMKASSFEGSGYAREAKKLAESDAELDAPSPTPEPDPEPVEAVPATPEPAEPEPVEEPEEEWGRPPGLEEPDSILLELGGQRFEAWRSGENWEVEFSGTVDTEGMREIMGRVLEGVA